MSRIIAILVFTTWAKVSPAHSVFPQSQLSSQISLAFSNLGLAPVRRFVSCNSGVAAACKRSSSFRETQRSGCIFPLNMMSEDSISTSLYGPVIVEDPETKKPLLRVSRTTDLVEHLDGCADVRLVNTIGWGDGHHATTRLCLEFLSRHAKELRSQVRCFVCCTVSHHNVSALSECEHVCF